MIAPGSSWLAEAAKRRAAGRQARLLVLAGEEALVGPGRLERGDQLGLAHHHAARVALVELLDREVERGPVDDRVVRRRRHAQDVGVLVPERAGQVVVDRVERRASAARPRVAGTAGAGSVRSRPASASSGDAARAPAPAAAATGQVERLEDERRHPPSPPPAVVGGVGQHQLVAPGSCRRRTGAAPPGPGSRPRAASRPPARPAAPAARGARSPGSGPRPGPAGTPPGTRGPWPCGRS